MLTTAGVAAITASEVDTHPNTPPCMVTMWRAGINPFVMAPYGPGVAAETKSAITAALDLAAA